MGLVRIALKLKYFQTFVKHLQKTLITPMSLLGMKGGTGIGTDPRFLGSIWTQIWTWLDLNPVIGSYGVEIFTKYAGILFTYYIRGVSKSKISYMNQQRSLSHSFTIYKITCKISNLKLHGKCPPKSRTLYKGNLKKYKGKF